MYGTTCQETENFNTKTALYMQCGSFTGMMTWSDRVKRAEADYTAENDLLGQLIEQCFVVGQGMKVEASIVSEMAHREGIKNVKIGMMQRGFVYKKAKFGESSRWAYHGIGLQT